MNKRSTHRQSHNEPRPRPATHPDFNLLLTALTVLALNPETERKIVIKNIKTGMVLNRGQLNTCSRDPEDGVGVTESVRVRAGWYLQQGHLHDQVDQVGQQFLQEILAVCFYTRHRGRDYQTHMADPR